MSTRQLTLATMLAITLSANAQEDIVVYSSNDANLNRTIEVDDVTSVVNGTLNGITAADKTVVEARQLNAMLAAIYKKLADLEAKIDGNSGSGNGGDITPSFPIGDSQIDANGHEYVDLGLIDEQGRTIYWATRNIGAESDYDIGSFYAWGDTHGYETPTLGSQEYEGYPFYDPQLDHSFTKYCRDGAYGIYDGLDTLQPEDDAVTKEWGGTWRMPTASECELLSTKCRWTYDEKAKGYFIIGPNQNRIFLPATGWYEGGHMDYDYDDHHALYWSSSLDKSSDQHAQLLCYSGYSQWADDFGLSMVNSDLRYFQFPVRGVCVAP